MAMRQPKPSIVSFDALPLPACADVTSRLRVIASGIAVLLHGGLVAFLLLSPAVTPPSAAVSEEIPIVIAMAEPTVEEPLPEPEPEPAAAPEPVTQPPPEPAPPEPHPPEPPPPEVPPPDPAPPEPPAPEPMPQEPPPPEPVTEPPPPDPVPEPEPTPDPLPEPLPAPPPPPPPQPQREPPPPQPRPRAAPRPAAPAAVAPSAPARTAAPAPAAQPAGPPSPSFLRALAAALERYKRYPEAARSRRAEGVVLLRFTLHRSGSVLNWAIARSAGDADLDRAVGEMIERARLPGMPTDMPGDSLTITVPVRFQIR